MRLLIKAPLSAYSGWGQDGIGLTLAALGRGFEPMLLPLEVVPPLPHPVVQRLAVPLVPPFDLLLAHVAANRANLTTGEIRTSKVRVLWSMWEWTSFQNHPAVDSINSNLRSFDLIVAYDPVSEKAFRELLGSDRPLLQIQGGYDPTPWCLVERHWRPPIRFFVAGHLTDRKNPVAALNAFSQLMEEYGPERFNAELHFKIVDRDNPFLSIRDQKEVLTVDGSELTPPAREFADLARGRNRVFLHSGTWSKSVLARFYSQMHCLVAPSRGEGKNLVALEFLSTGGTVIATDIGGHSVWIDESYAYRLRCSSRPATWPVPTARSHEAEPDFEHLKELMWRVYSDPECAGSKGRLASSVIPIRCDWNAAFSRLMTGLIAAGVDLELP